MRTRGKQRLRPLSVSSATLGLLLAGFSAPPAQAAPIPQQWFLNAMHAPEIWKTSTGRGITVAVIDSGVDPSMPDLKGQVLDGEDFSGNRGDEHTDSAGHGTSMALLIAGSGASGSTNGGRGLAPGAKILPIRMLYAEEVADRFDAGVEYSETLTQAIRYAADSKAQIINMSIGRANQPGLHDVDTPELRAAVRYALSKGKLLFASAGNDGDKGNPVQYPSATPGVVAVGAIDKHAEVADFSEQGPEVDVTAPGVEMVYPCKGGAGVCVASGTSHASAIASASAALIWSAHPDWTNNQVLRVMLDTLGKSTDGANRNDSLGYGVVRPRRAFTQTVNPGPADVYPLPDLAAAAAKSPSPKAPKPTAPAKHEKAAPKPDDGGGTLRWVGGGVAAGLLIGAAGILAVRRSRRRTAAAPPPPAHPPYVPAQGPHHPSVDSEQHP
ncbi:type VII secretion-associated serine protease mycosin [Streptomyces sp. NPDC090119]|uniref:type VII secretion-associated serine protease mycosin n=1 Tax=Streptomyces sp. NPDC090119 TaxID=3365951 RepID=UPI0038142C02